MLARSVSVLVAVALAFSWIAPSALAGGGHEHPGVTDARPDETDHAHGDSDDRHDSPDSPCHHHVMHCDCSPALVGLDAEAAGILDPSPVGRAPLSIDRLLVPPVLSTAFHVPIA